MAAITPQTPGVSGTGITYSAATAGGDTLVVGSDVYLIVRNGSGSAVTVTLVTPGNEFNGQPVPDTAVSVPATSDFIIPASNVAYRNSSGNVAITYSSVTSVTVAALSL